jgi:hypothetical protein
MIPFFGKQSLARAVLETGQLFFFTLDELAALIYEWVASPFLFAFKHSNGRLFCIPAGVFSVETCKSYSNPANQRLPLRKFYYGII